jgi:hypothetical protein
VSTARVVLAKLIPYPLSLQTLQPELRRPHTISSSIECCQALPASAPSPRASYIDATGFSDAASGVFHTDLATTHRQCGGVYSANR